MHLVYAFLHYMAIGDLFVGSKPVSLNYLYSGGKESFFGGLSGDLSIGLLGFCAKMGESFFTYFGFLRDFSNSPGELVWVLLYAVQRLIGFVCTDDIVFFTWVCLILQYFQDILFFLGELLYTLIGYFLYDYILPVICFY